LDIGGGIINRKLLLFVLLFFGIALVLNVGCVAATNSTNLTVQSNNSSSVIDPNKVSTTSTTLKTSLNTVTSAQLKTSVKTVGLVNVYGLTLAQMKDGLLRAQTFYNKNNRLPNYVSFGTVKVPIATFQKIIATHGMKIVVKVPANIWVSLKNFAYDKQDTSYTCGPSSLKMAFSNYGMNLNEMGLASYAGSNTISGTTHYGLINSVYKVNTKYGTHFRSWDSTFSSVGWTGLYNYLSANKPVILHIRSFLNPDSGHYVVLTGLNLKLRLAKIADPSFGYRTLSFSQLEARMSWVISTGRTTKPLIFLTKA
jgi:predicted double-glycine peptidase